MIKRNRKGKRGPVQAKKVVADGITFQSGLERYCYKALKTAKLFDKYEQERFSLIDGFTPTHEYYAHQSNGKGDFIHRPKSVLGITYRPDFTARDYIIECKGRPNESFPLRFKLFRKWLVDNGDTRDLYMPKNQKDVDVMIEIIKNKRNGNSKKTRGKI